VSDDTSSTVASVPASATTILTIQQLGRQPVHVLLATQLVVGRDCEGFLLADAQASRRHAEFRQIDGRVTVTDLGSSNGTQCNGRATTGETTLRPGDVVVVGSSEIVVGSTLAAQLTERAASSRALTTEIQHADRPKSSIMRLTDSVQDERVAVQAANSRGEGTFTIVFSDIEGSTARSTSEGDHAWMSILDVHNTIVRSQLALHQGREVKSMGDGFMLSFDSARRAVSFAIDLQRELERRRISDPSWDVNVRIGIHSGEAILSSDGDLYGRHVNIAARIADCADGGEILVSNIVRELTAGRVELAYEATRTVTLKGIGDQLIHQLTWRPTS
jgi:class 3 adenylate cyclase